MIRRAVVRNYFNAAGSEGRSGDSQGQASPVGIGLSAASRKDREVLKGSESPKTGGEFRDRTWQRVSCEDRTAGGNKMPSGDGSKGPNGPGQVSESLRRCRPGALTRP